MKPIFLIFLFPALAYILWLNGLMIISVKRSVLFIGRRGAGRWGANFTGCTGYTKRSLKLTSGREYTFTLENDVDMGEITVEISKDKQLIAVFDKTTTAHTLTAEKGLYVITTHFKSASGSYDLKWN